MRIHTRSRSVVAVCALALGLVTACGTSGDDTDAAAELPTLNDDATDDAAAGGSETDEAPGDNPSDDVDGEEVDPDLVFADYEKCMGEHGVDISFAEPADDGSGDSGAQAGALESTSLDDEAMDEAMAACDSILDDAFGDFEPSPEQEAEMADQMLEMQKCLDEKGFDIDLDGDTFLVETEGDGDEFEQAMRACEPEFVFDGGVEE